MIKQLAWHNVKCFLYVLLDMNPKVVIVDFELKFASHFKSLNEDWIKTYFEIEEADILPLSKPQEYIIDQGGLIKVALLNNEPVGVCALQKLDNPKYDFELAKMAVSPSAQGNGIGFLLGESIIKDAFSKSSKPIYLVTNSNLIPAIRLYEKLGFKKIEAPYSNYKRGDYPMIKPKP